MQHKVKFHRICMCCGREYGVKYDYPPNDWNSKDRLETHGICDECNPQYRKDNGLKEATP